MNQASGAAGSSGDFEFTALAEARHYRGALVRQFAPFLRGNVLEVGAGIGQFTAAIGSLPGLIELVSVEPDPRFWPVFRAAHLGRTLVPGTVVQVSSGIPWNAILSVNVLEHIEDDRSELTIYQTLLREARGALCLFVPARPEIYAPIDRDFGHCRRYTRPGLTRLLHEVGFTVERIHYFNLAGYFGWWFNFCLLRQRRFSPAAVRAFDRWIFPPTHWLESKVRWPPLGQSLLAVARAG